MPFACLRQFDSFSFLYFPSSFSSFFLSCSLLLYLFPCPHPLASLQQFFTWYDKKIQRQEITKKKSHKNALLWTERMRSRRREEFPRGFIKSVKWLLRIGGTQKPGKFFKEDLCHVIQRKNRNQFSVKNWQSMSWLFLFDKFQALCDVGGLQHNQYTYNILNKCWQQCW